MTPQSPDWLQRAVAERASKLGLSGAELARRTQLPQSLVSDFLAGRRAVRSVALERLLDALGLTVRVGRAG